MLSLPLIFSFVRYLLFSPPLFVISYSLLFDPFLYSIRPIINFDSPFLSLSYVFFSVSSKPSSSLSSLRFVHVYRLFLLLYLPILSLLSLPHSTLSLPSFFSLNLFCYLPFSVKLSLLLISIFFFFLPVAFFLLNHLFNSDENILRE